MKKLLTIALFGLSLSCFSQDISMKNVDMHLPKYKAQKNEGIAFMLTGMAIITGGSIIATQTKGPDSHQFGQAVVVIGSVFSFYGILRALTSEKHLKRSVNFQNGLARK